MQVGGMQVGSGVVHMLLIIVLFIARAPSLLSPAVHVPIGSNWRTRLFGIIYRQTAETGFVPLDSCLFLITHSLTHSLSHSLTLTHIP